MNQICRVLVVMIYQKEVTDIQNSLPRTLATLGAAYHAEHKVHK